MKKKVYLQNVASVKKKRKKKYVPKATYVSTGRIEMSVVIQNIPVMFRRMTAVPAPLQIRLSNLAFNNELDEAAREQAVKFAFIKRQIIGRRLLW